MPRPCSIDLRRRVVEAYENNEGTYEEIAARFQVGEASVDRWLALKREQGSVEPKQMGGRRYCSFDEDAEEVLRFLVFENPDSTRDELVDQLAQEIGAVVPQ